MNDDLTNFVDEYRAHCRKIGMPYGDQVADDLMNSLSRIEEHGNDNGDAIELIDKVRNVIRSKRPLAERLAEFEAVMAGRK